MKKILTSACLLGAILTAPLSGGCGGESTNYPKVDVAAKLQQLKGSTEEKSTALTELATAGPNAAPAIDELIPLLKHEDYVIRQLAAYALGQIGPQAKRAVPALKQALNDQQMSVLTSVQNALVAIDPSSAPKQAIPNVSGQ